ncbi:hypothetical protein ACFCVU_22640 [Peribacillus butanolivorans]|uniref:hypothetical protein n=1 Tax=Peribacillus butanolivorans TaxID=421767 RepID=UPI0035DE1C55
MGYIAPVTQFDYIQYANRIVRAAENVRNVKGTATIQPIRYNQVMEDETGQKLPTLLPKAGNNKWNRNL